MPDVCGGLVVVLAELQLGGGGDQGTRAQKGDEVACRSRVTQEAADEAIS